MVLYFGGILLVVPKFLRYKKELLHLSWEKWGWASCRNLYKELKISPLKSLYIYIVSTFIYDH
jgi:hypothetical protein